MLINKHFIAVKIVDNTKLNSLTDGVFEKGYTEYKQIITPNEGIDQENGDTVHFLNFDNIYIGGVCLVRKNNVFLRNGYLQKPGVLCEKYNIKRRSKGLLFCNEDYFRVLDQRECDVVIDELALVNARTSVWFNYNKKQLYFVSPEKIFLVISKKGYRAGPKYVLLDEKPKRKSLEIEPHKNKLLDKPPQAGIKDNEFIYYFRAPSYYVTLQNKRKLIVAKKDVKLIDRYKKD